jgi:predicted flap endonuclease-1-like 5' DNA nuclease
MASLIDVEGIGPKFAAKLKEAGIGNAEALLEQGATPKGRKEIAEKSGIGDNLILEWVNHVDLFRIKGVGPEYADLLEEAGVDTIPELAQRRADHLFEKMVAINLQKKLVRKMPIQSQVENWIEQAKSLPRLIKY